VRNRIVKRLAVIAAGVIIPLFVSAGPALAKLKPDVGEVPGPSLGVGDTILIFVVIPLGAFLVIAGLSLLPSALSRPRYRPGRPWEHEPTWIGEPGESADGASGSTARGGASAEW
jgi:hypothetical protein